MMKRLQIFISSTYTDLIEERQAAVMAILKAGHFPAGMELFVAGAGTWKTIQKWIDDSDVFMLILGGRYGSIDPNSGKSYPQAEYEYALSSGKPTFALVISDEFLKAKTAAAGGEVSKVMELENRKEWEEFKSVVMTNIVAKFADLRDIKLGVHETLNDLIRTRELVGWIRGNEVIDSAKAIEQIGAMQRELQRLQAENKKLSAAGEASVADYERIRAYLMSKHVELSLMEAGAGSGDFTQLPALVALSMCKAEFVSGVENSTMASSINTQLFWRLVPILEPFELLQREKVKAGVMWTRYVLSATGRRFLARFELEQDEERRKASAPAAVAPRPADPATAPVPDAAAAPSGPSPRNLPTKASPK